jgi:hypothetical protein
MNESPEPPERMLTPEELIDIERFQKQRRKHPVESDAWLYVAEIDRLLTHIRLGREQLENEIFQEITEPRVRSVSPDAPTVIQQADAQASAVHDAIYAEPFDKQKASDEVWKLHEILRGAIAPAPDTGEVARRIAVRLALELTETDLSRAKHRAKNPTDKYLTQSGEGDKVLAAIADVVTAELANVGTQKGE